MKYIINIPVIALSVVLGVTACRLGAPSESLVWYILGGCLTMSTILGVDNAILDIWANDRRDTPMPSSILDLPCPIVGLTIILWPIIAVAYLPVKCATLVKRHLEARRKRSSPKGVSLTHTTPRTLPGAPTPPICTFKKGCY